MKYNCDVPNKYLMLKEFYSSMYIYINEKNYAAEIEIQIYVFPCFTTNREEAMPNQSSYKGKLVFLEFVR